MDDPGQINGHRPDGPPPPESYAMPAHEQATRATPAGSGAGSGGHRDPGSRGTRLLALVGMVALVAVLAILQRMPPPKGSISADPDTVPGTSGLLKFTGRYLVGTKSLIPTTDDEDSDSLDLTKSMDAYAITPVDRLRVTMVSAELDGPTQALMRSFKLSTDLEEEQTKESTHPSWIAEDLYLTNRALADPSSLSDDERETLLTRHGWFAEVLLAHDLPAGDPERDRLKSNALKAVIGLVGVVIAAILIGAVGLALLIIGLVKLSAGKLKLAYHRPVPGGSVYLESMTVFLLGFLAVSLGAGFVAMGTGIDLSAWVIWLLILAPMWPLIRGARRDAWKHAVGWHTGKGALREVGAGILGYVAGLPILGMGMLVTLAFAVVSGLFQSEEAGGAAPPIMDRLSEGGIKEILGLFLLTVVWAPIAEESIFRGALFHHMRGTSRFVLSATVVAFIFAIIHPYPLFAVPMLMSLAFVFAMIREWRGSIIGCITAHALHNAVVTSLLVYIFVS